MRNTSRNDLHDYILALMAQPRSERVQAAIGPPDQWKVSIDTGHLLDGLVRHVRPRSVLEFGAGGSSLIVATALNESGGGRLTSVEHQPDYSAAAWQQIATLPAVDAKLVEARLEWRLSKFGCLYEYRPIREELRRRGPFDLVFIDAPPGHLGRAGTLLRASEFVSDGALVVLDDAARIGEQTDMKRWARALDTEVVFQTDVRRGVAVLRVPRAVTPRFSLRTYVGTWHDRFTGRGPTA